MTLKSKLPLHIFQKIFLVRDIVESIFRKIEVITDSTAILYSVRLLIVLLALLMGYIHTPKDSTEVSKVNKVEITSPTNQNSFKPVN